MGINYYFFTGKKHKEECNLGHVHLVEDRLHIGKSSFGRYFTLHLEKLEDGTLLDSLEAWKAFAARYPKGHVEDEEGEKIELDCMWDIITRKGRLPSPWAQQNFNKSMIGKRVEYEHSTGLNYMYYDEWGERGFVKTHGAPVGKDGLYVLLEGEFS